MKCQLSINKHTKTSRKDKNLVHIKLLTLRSKITNPFKIFNNFHNFLKIFTVSHFFLIFAVIFYGNSNSLIILYRQNFIFLYDIAKNGFVKLQVSNILVKKFSVIKIKIFKALLRNRIPISNVLLTLLDS